MHDGFERNGTLVKLKSCYIKHSANYGVTDASVVASKRVVQVRVDVDGNMDSNLDYP